MLPLLFYILGFIRIAAIILIMLACIKYLKKVVYMK